MYAGRLSSIKTLLPFDYYYLDYCKPNEGIDYLHHNIGERITGDNFANTPHGVSIIHLKNLIIFTDRHDEI